MFSPLEMLATGTVGPIALGTAEGEVRSTLGPPADTSVTRAPTIWKYGALEVTLASGRVELLHLELDQQLPDFLEADGLSSETTPEQLEQLLAHRQVPRKAYPPLTFEPEQTALLVGEGRSVAIFSDGKLAAITSSDHL